MMNNCELCGDTDCCKRADLTDDPVLCDNCYALELYDKNNFGNAKFCDNEENGEIIMNNEIKACYMCNNSIVDRDLPANGDYSCCSIGNMPPRTRLMLCSGYGRPLRIVYEVFNDQYGIWRSEGIYYPKFCPNCGREIKEYQKKEG